MAVLGSIERNAVFGRPDDYQATLAARYQALTTADLNRAAPTWTCRPETTAGSATTTGTNALVVLPAKRRRQ